MQKAFAKHVTMLAAGALIALSAQAFAESGSDGATDHDHDHSKEHAHEHSDDDIYNGYFDDDQIKARDLSDWAGDWQSVFPLLQDGTLDPVMAHKAAHGDKIAAEYTAYYQTGYATKVERILIEGDSVTFFEDGTPLQGHYADDGHEVLTYEAGNRGVRYIFEKTGGDAEAPDYIQFSDHAIAPTDAGHFHLYWGDDRAALLKEVTNWPTYYPADLGGEEVAEEMMAH
ncbi:ZinT family metal-binding protein [Sediminimonas qiaohouensis]|uniref:ZinT family metal-binding protein n=1 Tax=Sediminimonas qiaohouensis TaxID=552061 RepID=UPI0004205119|nr:metal-binding protein ZinT [Sediminimonas qiaohouensis]